MFDTLAPAVAELFERSADLCELYSTRFPIVVVDEFQDTNVDQWRVVQALSERSTIICLADPDQRIFDHIEGVDEHRLENAKILLEPETFDLSSDNHRSPESGILEYANAVLRNTPAATPKNLHVLWYRYDKPEHMTHAVVQRALDRLRDVVPGAPTLAVLTRVNTFAGRISEQLGQEGLFQGGQLRPVDHVLYWDPELAAASALVVASVLEWPTRPAEEAVSTTLRSFCDYYRTKVGLGTAGARKTVATLERAIGAIAAGKAPAAKPPRCCSRRSRSTPRSLGARSRTGRSPAPSCMAARSSTR